MTRTFSRLLSVLLVITALLSLCACGETATTTTIADVTTTTLADEVTTTVIEGEATTTVDNVTTTVGNGDDSATTDSTGGNAKPTTKKDEVTTTAAKDPWGSGGKPTKATTTTVGNTYATLAKVERDPKYVNDEGIYNLFKGYCGDTVMKSSEWLPTIGYVKDNKVVDVMFDGAAVTASITQVYYGNLNTKVGWDEWRVNCWKNVDEIEKAAASVQKSLNLEEYKFKVFPMLANPSNHLTNYDNWGSLNGTKMKVSNKEHRFEMIKYMVDSYVAEFNKKGYKNVEMAGFYWFDEYIAEADLAWYKQVTDYIRSKGLITIISPYYKAGGWTLCDEAGFDLHSMQTNFFPNQKVGEMNCGTINRLPALSALINNGEIGDIEFEMNGTDNDCITGLKEILKEGVNSGIVNGYELFYFGPRPLYTISKSREAYIRSAYDDLYKYIHNKLVPSEMVVYEFEGEQQWLDGAIDWI